MIRPDHKYTAFISYAHGNERFANRLHSRLERYRLPRRLAARLGRDVRLGTIFRDRDELSSSASLSDAIRTALTQSTHLIVVCSPEAAASRWVNEEIRTFCEIHDPADVLLIISPDVESGASMNDVFPPEILRHAREPLAADARAAADGARRATLKLVAGLLEVGFDELQQRERSRRRNRLLSTSAVMALLLTITAGLLTQARKAEEEARTQRAQAEALVGYMVDDLEQRLQEYEEVGELDAGLARALSYFAGLDTREMDADTLEKYRTALRGIGSVRIRQGKLEDALEAFQRAAAVGETLVEREQGNAAYWYELAQNTYYIGEAHWEMQDIPTAARYIEEAMKHAERAVMLEPEHFPYQLEFVFGLNNLGAVNTRLKRFPAAITALTTALDNIKRLQPEFPDYELDLLNQEVESVSWQAEISTTTGQFDAAFNWHERELALHKQLFDRTGNPQHRARTVDALGFYAKTLTAVGRSADAARMFRERIEIARELIKADPDNAFWRRRLHMGELLLAQALYHEGDLPSALELLEVAEQGLQDLKLEERDAIGIMLDQQYLIATRAYMLLEEQPDEALEIVNTVIEALQPTMAAPQVNAIALGYYLRAVIVRNAALLALGRPADLKLTASANTLLESQGEVDSSVYDKASNALLLILLVEPRAARLTEELNELGYASEFYLAMLDRFAGV